MTLLKKYRSARELINDKAISIPLWDLLVIIDIAERAPMLEAEARYLESMNNNIARTTSSFVAKALAEIEAENNKQREGEPSVEETKESIAESVDKPTADGRSIHTNGKEKVKSQAM